MGACFLYDGVDSADDVGGGAGPREDVLDRLYSRWRADVDPGQASLMVAADTDTVVALNARARTDRVAAGHVTGAGATTRDGGTLGVGDTVVTRHNARDLTHRHRLGQERRHLDPDRAEPRRDCHPDPTSGLRPGPGRLPGRARRTLLRRHRPQGRTVDTCHAYLSPGTTREPLYVMATRGRHTNTLYVNTTDPDHDADHGHPSGPAADPAAILRAAVTTTGLDRSAHQTRDAEKAAEWTPARVAAEGAALHAVARERRLLTVLTAAGVTPDQIEAAKTADQWRPLLDSAAAAEHHGLDLAHALARPATGDDPAERLADLATTLNAWSGRAEQRRAPATREDYRTPSPTGVSRGLL